MTKEIEVMKKTNNKGFSLVELIVVVAIMAVLMVVLAPQYLRYVEKTRLQKDNSAIAEIANAIKISAADEGINQEIAAATNAKPILFKATYNTAEKCQVISMVPDGAGTAAPKLETELKGIFGDNGIETGSNSYNAQTAEANLIQIKVTMDTDTNMPEVNIANYIDTANGEPATTDTLLK